MALKLSWKARPSEVSRINEFNYSLNRQSVVKMDKYVTEVLTGLLPHFDTST